MTSTLEPTAFHLWYGSAGGEVTLSWDADARRFCDPQHVWSERVRRGSPPADACKGLSAQEIIRLADSPPYAEFVLHDRPSACEWERFWTAADRSNVWQWHGTDFGCAAKVCDGGWRLNIRYRDHFLDVEGASYPGNWVFFKYHLFTLLRRRSVYLEHGCPVERASRIPHGPDMTVLSAGRTWSSEGWRRLRLDQYDDGGQTGLSQVIYSWRGKSVYFFHEGGKNLQIHVVPGELTDFQRVDELESWREFSELTGREPVQSLAAEVTMPTDWALERAVDKLTTRSCRDEGSRLSGAIRRVLEQQYPETKPM
jgi:hypothetical protein